MATVPVTGQAKGIAIGRGGEQAFDMPRRACPRLNVTVRLLAALVVAARRTGYQIDVA